MNEIVAIGSRLLWLKFSCLFNQCSPTVFKTDFVYYFKIMPGERTSLQIQLFSAYRLYCVASILMSEGAPLYLGRSPTMIYYFQCFLRPSPLHAVRDSGGTLVPGTIGLTILKIHQQLLNSIKPDIMSTELTLA